MFVTFVVTAENTVCGSGACVTLPCHLVMELQVMGDVRALMVAGLTPIVDKVWGVGWEGGGRVSNSLLCLACIG